MKLPRIAVFGTAMYHYGLRSELRDLDAYVHPRDFEAEPGVLMSGSATGERWKRFGDELDLFEARTPDFYEMLLKGALEVREEFPHDEYMVASPLHTLMLLAEVFEKTPMEKHRVALTDLRRYVVLRGDALG